MSGNVLVVLQTSGVGWHRMSFEALAAGQKLASELGVACSAAVLGESATIAPLTAELATKNWRRCGRSGIRCWRSTRRMVGCGAAAVDC